MSEKEQRCLKYATITEISINGPLILSRKKWQGNTGFYLNPNFHYPITPQGGRQWSVC